MTVVIDAEVARGAFRLHLQTRLAEPATGVFGPSGSGKTTLLHLIAGLVRPTSGRVMIDDTVLDDTAAGIHIPSHRRRIGMVFQHGHLFQHLTVDGNLRYGERLVAPAARRIPYAALIELLELGSLLTRRPASLSGGERQRVALGRALLASPRLLLLDEPLAALDRGLKRQILPYLRRIQTDLHIPFIHVSHDLGEILQLTRDLLLMERGAMVARGDVCEIVADGDNVRRLHGLGLVNVLRATIVRHDAVTGLTTCALDCATEIVVSLRDEPPGTRCDLLIRPEDVMLSRERLTGISVQNQIAGRVVRLSHADARTIVEIDIGEPLLVEISKKAVADLALIPGATMWCLCKAQTILLS